MGQRPAQRKARTQCQHGAGAACNSGNHQRELNFGLDIAIAAAAVAVAVVLTLGQQCRDSGGSKSCRTGRGQDTMAPALRLFLLLLLAVALTARAAQAAPWQAKAADEHDRKHPQAPWLHEDFLPLEPPAGVPVGKTLQGPLLVALGKPSSPVTDEHAGKASPTPWHHEDLLPLEHPAGLSAEKTVQGPLLVASGKPSSHHRGPPRGRNKPSDSFLKTSKTLKNILSQLERLRERHSTEELSPAVSGVRVLSSPVPRGARCLQAPAVRETENVLAKSTVLPAQRWSTARPHTPLCPHRCSRRLKT
ncbi:PREDICTED: uncharacterized protein LOC101809575 [Ficedula albicollis]|uniref:uncharacterized protein LOC101809575 n=1 Tax=Ficedula albicollis TaxID=59894 RepID=UPI00035A295F|nr:PREDICTED: uncharacterized protein LOC101809575 [Ficedula albicollis]